MKDCRLQEILKHVGAGHRLLQNRRDQITKKKVNKYVYDDARIHALRVTFVAIRSRIGSLLLPERVESRRIL